MYVSLQPLWGHETGVMIICKESSLLRRHSFGSSRTPPQRTFAGEECVTSQKNVCVGGYKESDLTENN